MKLNAALAKSWLVAASLSVVAPIYAQTMGSTPAPSADKPSTKAAPAKAKPQPTPAPKVEKPEDIILPGVVKPRPSGGFMTVEVVDGKLKVSFYDAKKKQIPAEVPRATARWRSNRTISEERTVLNPDGEGKSLIGSRLVRPPFTFKIHLNLLTEDGTAAETYIIDLNAGESAGAEPAEPPAP